MKCLRALLVAGKLSARRGFFLKKNLIQLQRSSYFQNSSLVPVRSIQMSTVLSTSNFAAKKHEKPDKESASQSLVKIEDIFKIISEHEKTAATFQEAVDIFCKQDIRRTGHVEFIYAALKKMPEFGVEKDVNVYNKILDVFPKKVFIPQNIFQKMLKYYPRQQDCATLLLEQMEHFDYFPLNCGAVSDEYEERFHQDIAGMEKRYQGKWSPSILADYYWNLPRDYPTAVHKRKVQFRYRIKMEPLMLELVSFLCKKRENVT